MEDKRFIEMMDKDGFWTTPVLFHKNRPRLQNNKSLAFKHAKFSDSNLRKDRNKKQHFLIFMQNFFDNGHAEIAPVV